MSGRFRVAGQPEHEHPIQRVIGSLRWAGSYWAVETEWFECMTCGFTTRAPVTSTPDAPEANS